MEADELWESRPSPSTPVIVIAMIFSVIVGIVWSLGLLVAAWDACGGDFGGYGAGANQKLDAACQNRRSRGAFTPLLAAPIVMITALCLVRWNWRRRHA